MKKYGFKKVITGVLLLTMLLMSLVGCSAEAGLENSNEESKTNETEESSEVEVENNVNEPVVGGEITVAFQSTPENFDPDHSSSDWVVTAVTNHVYEGLFEFNASNAAIPQLAESYTLIDEGKTYDIILRKGVLFQDGDEMKAEDVKASLDRWFEVNPAGASIAESLVETEIINDYQLLVKFDKVYAPFINILASPVSRQKCLLRKKK